MIKALPVFLLFLAASASAAPGKDCRKAFGFEPDTRLSLSELQVLLEPHVFRGTNTFLEVREFDTDFLPDRKGLAGVAIVSAGDHDAGDRVAGGMVLSDYEAYFDEDKSLAMNKANGGLNAVFVLPRTAEQCAGMTYTVSFGEDGRLTVNGKLVGKVEISKGP